MNPLHDLPAGNTPDELNVFIEIPRGSKNKYEIDKDSGLIKLDRVFYGPQTYPMDYGMVPRTHWHDGDPLDALIMTSTEPYFPGVVVPARPIAVVRMVDNGEKDEKLICVPLDDPRMTEFKDKDDIAPHVLKELVEFFVTYKNLEKKKVTVGGIDGAEAARKVVDEGVALYQEKFRKQ